jgi:uncharacterized C2H2 Zn-finger protein
MEGRGMKDLRCIFGLHTGQREGGTMVFYCPRCERSFWQRRDYSHVTAAADRLIEQGRSDEARTLVREALRDA